MLGWWSQPASFSSPAIKPNPPWSPNQSWWLLLAREKKMMTWKGGGNWKRDRKESGSKKDNGCWFISHELKSSYQEQSVVAMHPWIFLFLQETFTSEDHYYSQSNLTLMSHQNINFGKYQPAVLLTRSLTIPILLRKSVENSRHLFYQLSAWILTVNLPNGNEFAYILRCYPSLTGPNITASRNKISLAADVSQGTRSIKAA